MKKKKKDELPKAAIHIERTTEYVLGASARRGGTPMDDCPFAAGHERIAWLSGWVNQRTREAVGDILLSYGINW